MLGRTARCLFKPACIKLGPAFLDISLTPTGTLTKEQHEFEVLKWSHHCDVYANYSDSNYTSALDMYLAMFFGQLQRRRDTRKALSKKRVRLLTKMMRLRMPMLFRNFALKKVIVIPISWYCENRGSSFQCKTLGVYFIFR